MALVLDTSVILAALDPDDDDHRRCAAILENAREPLVVPIPVLTELDHLIARRGKTQAWHGFIQDVAEGAFELHLATPALVFQAAALQARYTDLRIGFVDAAVFLTCVELGEDKVATLDHRHFSVLRTEDGRALRLLPEIE